MHDSEDDTKVYIKARIVVDPFVLRLFEHFQEGKTPKATLVTRFQGAKGRHEECSVRVMIDGELLKLERTGYRHKNEYEEIRATVPHDVVRRMAEAEEVAGRVCKDEWRLEEGDRELLKKYLARLREESAWSNKEARAVGERDTSSPQDAGSESEPSEGEDATSQEEAEGAGTHAAGSTAGETKGEPASQDDSRNEDKEVGGASRNNGDDDTSGGADGS